MALNLNIQFGTSGLTGASATLRAGEAQPADQEIVLMETLVKSAVTLAKFQKQLFVKARTAQVSEIFIEYNLYNIINYILKIYRYMNPISTLLDNIS